MYIANFNAAAGLPSGGAQGDWSQACRDFLAHWLTLRKGAPIPATEDFFDSAEPCFAPALYIVELVGDAAIVRLQGSELELRWNAYITGYDLHAGMPGPMRAKSLANMRHVAGVPCGYLARNSYQTSLNRTVTSDLIQLPLGVKAGRPPRVVCLTVMDRDEIWEETVSNFKTHALGWIDLGAGVPPAPPLDLLG
jgi:hypothetical protein